MHRLACSYYKRYQAAGCAKRKQLAEQKKIATKAQRNKKGKGQNNTLHFESVGLLG